MSKHTPGPWETNHDGHGGIYVGDAKERQIGFVSLRSEQEANARLIAAAPDLLEALIDAERICSEVAAHLGLSYSDAEGIAKNARAAIAKATGEAA